MIVLRTYFLEDIIAETFSSSGIEPASRIWSVTFCKDQDNSVMFVTFYVRLTDAFKSSKWTFLKRQRFNLLYPWYSRFGDAVRSLRSFQSMLSGKPNSRGGRTYICPWIGPL